jgi:hypothetical protein
MAAIVADHAPMLKHYGFRKRRFGFNRAADDGLIHMVHFWMAPKEPPAWTEVPGLRERRYGSFRLDFGVYVPEMARMGTPRSSWVNDYNCQLRETVGRLLTGEWKDFWWRLDDPDASARAGDALREVGLPWLDRFPNATAVLDEFDRVGPIEIAPTRQGRSTLPTCAGLAATSHGNGASWRNTWPRRSCTATPSTSVATSTGTATATSRNESSLLGGRTTMSPHAAILPLLPMCGCCAPTWAGLTWTAQERGSRCNADCPAKGPW